MKKIRVMIVEDSGVVRAFLENMIGQDPRLEVVAAVDSAEEALRVLDRVSPDVISMDIRLPGMNGFEATQHIMVRKPTPIVVVSASIEAEDLNISMNALRAGALTVVEKPVGASHQDYEQMAARVCTQLFLMSQVKVIRQRISRSVNFSSVPANAEASPRPLLKAPPLALRLMGIVASTGGPAALAKVLGELPATFSLPIVLVQHITACFHEGFVAWLRSVTPLGVVVAKDGDAAAPGKIYVAPAERHLRVEGRHLRLDNGPAVSMQKPSGTILLESMADSLGAAALGVLLTGMGEDGAEGLRQIRLKGGYTIAEDETTAVVYGMPAAAARLGAVCEQLPLPEIASRILDLVGRGTS